MTNHAMGPKERVRTAFAHQEPDRVPVDYFCNPGIDLRLKQHYSLGEDDDEGLLQALGVDFRYAWATYSGLRLHPDLPGRTIDEWGIHRRWVEHESGGYWDYCDFPLRDASLQEIEAWPLPSPDDFDYSMVSDICAKSAAYCLVAGNAGVGDIINSNSMLRNMEQVLVDLMTGEPALLRLIDRRHEVQLEVARRVLEAGQGRFDLFYIGEDLGTQIGPMISMKLFRREIRPRLQKFVDLAHRYNLPVMFHSCGSSSWAFNDFIDMGVSVVDTLQPEAVNMSPAYLKSCYGDRLSFHGCISTGGPVAYGSTADVEQNVRETLDRMMPGGGYALAPSHALQDNSPTENVIALYDTARSYGRYR